MRNIKDTLMLILIHINNIYSMIDKIEKAVGEITNNVDFLELYREVKDIVDELVDSDKVKLSYVNNKDSVATIVTRRTNMDKSLYYIKFPYELNKLDDVEKFTNFLLASRKLIFYLQGIDLVIHDPKYSSVKKILSSESKTMNKFNLKPGDYLEKLLIETLEHIESVTGCEWTAHFADGYLLLRFRIDYTEKERIKKFESFRFN